MKRAVRNKWRLLVSVLTLSLATLGGGLAASGTWASTGAMNTARWDHTATLLLNGEVLVTGGENSGVALASTEVYHPSSETWSSSGSMAFPRRDFTSTLLAGGGVLVTGGYTNGGAGTTALPTAEIWTSSSNGWSSTGSMSVARAGHTATLLQNGTVLVAGGSNGFAHLASAEIYALGTWSTTGAMSEARAEHTATLLQDGRVLVTGGWDSSTATFLASAEIYDPQLEMWSPAGSMSVARIQHTATLLQNGKVLIAGGHNINGGSINILASAEIYDPANGTWSPPSSMNTARTLATAALLPDGTVLVSGGDIGGQGSAEIYDPTLGTWSPTASMSVDRRLATATLLTDGTVLVAGGNSNSGYLASAEIYTPPPPTDTTPPQVSCGAADTVWHGTDVSISCTATDPESGLANPADSSFTLMTTVAAGSDDANAGTNTRQVCNTKNLCTTAGPIFGNKVDRKAPTISITSPGASATYQLNAVVAASYTCSDGIGSGMFSCQGNVASGSAIDTSSTGTKTFTVNARDNVGNVSSASVTYTVASGGGGGQASADLGLTLSAPPKVAPGGTLTYSIAVTNRSNTTANGAVVSDALPPGTVFASGTTSQGTITSPPVGSNGTVTVNLGSVAGNATANITLNVTVTAATGATLTDTATVTATTQDLNQNNNSATQSTRVK